MFSSLPQGSKMDVFLTWELPLNETRETRCKIVKHALSSVLNQIAGQSRRKSSQTCGTLCTLVKTCEELSFSGSKDWAWWDF